MNETATDLSCAECGDPIEEKNIQWCSICHARKRQEERFKRLVEMILQSCNEEHLPAALHALEQTFHLN